MLKKSDQEVILKVNNSDQIFRKEVISESSNRLGSAANFTSISNWILSAFFAILVVVCIFFINSVTYARKETIEGYTSPIDGAVRVTAQINGILESIAVEEGQIIKFNDEIAVISADPATMTDVSLADQISQLQTIQQQAQEQQLIAKSQQLQSQLAQLFSRRLSVISDIKRLEEEGLLLSRKKELQAETFNAYVKLKSQGMISNTALRQQENIVLEIEQEIKQSERSKSLQQHELIQITPQIKRLESEMQIVSSGNSVETAQLRERQLNSSAQLRRKLIAPVPGEITTLQFQVGQPVTANQTIAVIVPRSDANKNSSLQVELWAPSSAIGFVKIGAPVRIMYASFPYQNFGVGKGVVAEISGAPVNPSELTVPIRSSEQLFRIRVDIKKSSLTAYGKEWPLKPGMKVSADIILDRQTLFEWILTPLRAISKKTD